MDGAKCGKPGMEHIWVDPEEGQYIQCAVCANKANGFHYGADTCGACKVGTGCLFLSLGFNYFCKPHWNSAADFKLSSY